MSLITPIPEDFKTMLRELPGIDTDVLIKALDTEPATAIRYNSRKISATEADGLYPEIKPVEWCETGRRISERPVFTADPLLHAGAYYVQDPSSMIIRQIVSRIADLMTKENKGTHIRALDFCAAPGGKTTAIIDALPSDAAIVANEVDSRRERILRENLQKWGASSVITTSSKSDRFALLGPIFDIVAVDAPCSGEGMMRKDEDARRQWTQHLTQACAKLQREILDDIAKTVRPGGWLIYSTCTFNPDENEKNAIYIRDEIGFEPLTPEYLGLEGTEACLPGNDIPALRFMPHVTCGEGLFISIFRHRYNPDDTIRNGCVATSSGITRKATKKENRKGSGKGGRKDIGKEKSPMKSGKIDWIADGFETVETTDGVSALRADMISLLEHMRANGIHITGAGQPAAVIKGRELAPDSRFVLDTACASNLFPVAELTLQDALAFLRKEALTLPEETPLGFVIVTYRKHPLGLVKNLGSRANNLYPKEWRILSRSEDLLTHINQQD